jgi:hypothetical protein
VLSIRWVYGRIRDELHWSNAAIDELRVSEMEEIFEHWRDEPPVGACVRAWLGVKPATLASAPKVAADVPAMLKEVTLEQFERLRREAEGFAVRANAAARGGQG